MFGEPPREYCCHDAFEATLKRFKAIFKTGTAEKHTHMYDYHDTVCAVSGVHPAYCQEDHLRCPRIDTCSICGKKRSDVDA